MFAYATLSLDDAVCLLAGQQCRHRLVTLSNGHMSHMALHEASRRHVLVKVVSAEDGVFGAVSMTLRLAIRTAWEVCTVKCLWMKEMAGHQTL